MYSYVPIPALHYGIFLYVQCVPRILSVIAMELTVVVRRASPRKVNVASVLKATIRTALDVKVSYVECIHTTLSRSSSLEHIPHVLHLHCSYTAIA